MTLSILIWLPAAVALLAAFLPAVVAPRLVMLGSFAAVGVALGFLIDFDSGIAGLQRVTDEVWIRELGIHYKLGLDGLNVLLVLVTTIVFAASILAANFKQWDRPKLFYFHFGLAESAVLGALTAQDLALFVVFFDLMLIPFYFLVGGWGGPNRVPAVTKLVIYTFVGSLFMLAGAIATAVIATPENGSITFVISELQRLPIPGGSQDWIFLTFAAAFLVKMPQFPLHGWMPDGYKAMPIEVLAPFSAVLSKVAAYGFLRIVLPIFPGASAHFQELMLFIALASVLYASAMAFTTYDARLVLGYSSVAQLGFIVLGIFSLQPEGAQGALLQMANHAIVVTPLFFIVGLLAARVGGSEDIRDMGGLAFRAPVLAAVFLIVALANLAMPGSSNFMAEFLLLLGVFKVKSVIAIVAFAGVVAASVYTLRIFIRTMHNRLGPQAESREMSLDSALAIVPLAALVVAFGLYPQFGLGRSQRSTEASIAKAQLILNPLPPPGERREKPDFGQPDYPTPQALRDAGLSQQGEQARLPSDELPQTDTTAPGGAGGTP